MKIPINYFIGAALLLSTLSSTSKVLKDKCLPGYGNQVLTNMGSDLTFCLDHSGRTCCSIEDSNKLRAKLAYVKFKTEVSDKCFKYTSKAMCSHCDGDIGTGVSDGLCAPFCEGWFQACKGDFIDPYLNADENLPFCKKDSLICSLVSDGFNNSRQFCELMGFRVTYQRQIEEEGAKDCFDGITSVAKHGKVKLQKVATSEETQDSVYQEFINKRVNQLYKLVRRSPYFKQIVEGVSLLGVILSLLLLYTVASMCFRRKLVTNPTRHKLSRDQIKALAAQRINKFRKEDTTKAGVPEKSEKSD